MNLKNKMNKAVFLDRDGTLNYDPGYLNSPDKLKILPNVVRGLKLLQKYMFLLIVITNQAGVAKGYLSEATLKKINKKLINILSSKNVKIKDIFYCIHSQEENCECRKPQPKLVFEAQKKYNIDLKNSFFIGDMETDIGCGKNACVNATIIVSKSLSPDDIKTWQYKPDYIAKNLYDAAKWIIKHTQS